MTTITLKPNQAALILETNEEGDIDVEVAFNEDTPEENEFSSAICEVIAYKLVEDEDFQDEILAAIEEGFEEDEEH